MIGYEVKINLFVEMTDDVEKSAKTAICINQLLNKDAIFSNSELRKIINLIQAGDISIKLKAKKAPPVPKPSNKPRKIINAK